jgi:hypothetical protein
MGYRFEFDRVNKILLLRVEGPLTDEAMTQAYVAIRKHSIATDARAGIWDLSGVTEHPISSARVRELANREPAMPNASERPRFIVASSTVGYGLARMFQLAGAKDRPLLQVVRTMEEALTALGVESARFEALE